MKIVKELTYSDVNDGQISVCNVTTNCPTLIKGVIGIAAAFNEPVTATLTFDPVSGANTSVRRIISNSFPGGYAWDMDTSVGASDPEGLFVEGNGELRIDLATEGTLPTAGRLLLMVDVEPFPLS